MCRGGVRCRDPERSGASAPDLILHNARIYTVDSRNSVAEAVAIAGDRIIRVGKDADVLALKAPSTRVLDMRGATIVPGFHDAHGHVVGLGASLQDVDLRGTSSYEEVVGRVRRRLANARPGEWIVGRGWDQNDWAEQAFPDARPVERRHRRTIPST